MNQYFYPALRSTLVQSTHHLLMTGVHLSHLHVHFHVDNDSLAPQTLFFSSQKLLQQQRESAERVEGCTDGTNQFPIGGKCIGCRPYSGTAFFPPGIKLILIVISSDKSWISIHVLEKHNAYLIHRTASIFFTQGIGSCCAFSSWGTEKVHPAFHSPL